MWANNANILISYPTVHSSGARGFVIVWLPGSAVEFDIFERVSQIRFEGLDLLRSHVHAFDAWIAFAVVESTTAGCGN